MKARILGALKAAAPSLLALAYVLVDIITGATVDGSTLRPILYGLVASVAVYLVPNLHSVDAPPVSDQVSKK